MYGDNANVLAKQAKRTQNISGIPVYMTETVRDVTREIRDLKKDCETMVEPFGGKFEPEHNVSVATALLVNYMSMRRNKRCLLVYHKIRTEKLEELVWKGYDVTDLGNAAGVTGVTAQSTSSMVGGNVTSNLSPQEEEYVRQYSDLLAAYKGHWTDIDLTGSLVPPKDLFIDVRVLKDAGEIETEYGPITLTKNSQLNVRQGDVERLIAQGYLQKLN